MENKNFALIGGSLKHSYSKIIHSKLGDYNYNLVEIEKDELKEFVNSDINGFNVTIPYKKEIIKYLDEIDKSALEIGAVNTVVKRNGKLFGYNTDFNGMVYMLSRAKISLQDKCVMILGSGGTSNTATAVCKYLGARKITIVSRSGQINYQNCYEQLDTQVIINTTPIGMYPNVNQSPIDLDKFPALFGVVDVIYNPSLTKLLYQAKQKGLKYSSGLPMLVAQAKYAKDYFLDSVCLDSDIERVLSELTNETQNIVLIGMPGCGKSSIGKLLSQILNKEFIDIDQEIVNRENRSIPEIFATYGEEYFRKVESEVLETVCKESGKIIATGGGVVTKEQNHFPLKCNGKVFYINRDVKMLSGEGRPLSKDLNAIMKLYEQRKDLYNKLADFVIDNNGDVEQAVQGVIEKL